MPTESDARTEQLRYVVTLPKVYMYLHALMTTLTIPVAVFSGWLWLQLRSNPAFAEELGQAIAEGFSGFTVAEGASIVELMPIIGAMMVVFVAHLWFQLYIGRVRYV